MGCSHDVDLKLGNEIAVTTRVTGMQQKRVQSIDSNTALRAEELRIDAYFNGTNTAYLSSARLHYNGEAGAWQFWDGSSQQHYFWPIEGSVYDPTGENITVTSLDFVGYSYIKPAYIGIPTYATGTGTSFTCDLGSYMTNDAQANQTEYLVAVSNGQTLADQEAHNGVPLTFKHPFALIKFVIAEGSGTHVSVDSIVIGDLNTAATCTYNGTTMSWSGHSGSADLVIEPATALQYGTANTVSDTMMVIPKSYTGTKTLTVRGSWDDWSVVEKQDISAEVAINWEPGYIYTYNLTVTKYALKVDVEKYTEQW